MSHSAPRPQRPRWAHRVRQDWIRALYRTESRGLLDEDLALKVGWALWARARDIARVSLAVQTGVVECPECGQSARRRRREHGRAAREPRRVRCGNCGHVSEWRAVKDALRKAPRCLKCLAPLEWDYAAGRVTCPGCGETMPFRTWRQRLRGRKRLPCPQCQETLRAPDPPGRLSLPSPSPPGPAAICSHCGGSFPWSEVRKMWRRTPKCTCGALLSDTDGVLRCPACGKSWTRTQYSRRLSRRRTGPCPGCGETISRERDLVQCGECGWEGSWNAFRRMWQGEALLTGAGVPACEQFVAKWPHCRDNGEQMILIDSFLHELHAGPLAPLFVSGGKASVLALLDELAGMKRPAVSERP